jgi:hypothetical protein
VTAAEKKFFQWPSVISRSNLHCKTKNKRLGNEVDECMDRDAVSHYYIPYPPILRIIRTSKDE